MLSAVLTESGLWLLAKTELGVMQSRLFYLLAMLDGSAVEKAAWLQRTSN